MKLVKFLFVWLTLLVSFYGCAAQAANTTAVIDPVKFFDENKRWYNGFTESWFYFYGISEEEIRTSIVQWEQIGADLKDSTNEWAGTYEDGGDTHGDYFRWSEKSGYVLLMVDKCRGGPMRIVRGKVSFDGSGLRLIPETTLGYQGAHNHSSDHPSSKLLLLVKWQGLSHLVPKENIESFADFTAGLGEYNNYMSGIFGSPFLVKMGIRDDEKESELPVFPGGYEKFVKKPVKAKIVSIGKGFRTPNEEGDDDSEKLIIPVKLNVGLSSGAKEGLQLFYIDEGTNWLEEIRIKKVFNDFSIAEISRIVVKKNCKKTETENCQNPEYRRLRIGLKLSTTGR